MTTRPEVLIPPLEPVAGTPPAARTDPYATVRCPGCKGVGHIDQDQYEGQISIECSNPACNYHETHDLRKAAS